MAFDISLRDPGTDFGISLSDYAGGAAHGIGRRGNRPRNRVKTSSVSSGMSGDFLVDDYGNFLIDELGNYLTWQ